MYEPIWRFLMDHLPRKIAPNLITITGTVVALSIHTILWYAAPQLGLDDGSGTIAWSWGPIHFPNLWPSTYSRICYAVVAGLIFVYMALDVMDGRQARRTGNATPLGQLFDHGSDAMACWVMAMGNAAAMQCGTGAAAFIMLHCSTVPFFAAIWVESCTGRFEYGSIGDAEGETTVAVLLLVSALFGPAVWERDLLRALLSLLPVGAAPEWLPAVTLFRTVAFVGVLGAVLAAANSVSSVVKHLRAHPEKSRSHAVRSAAQFVASLVLHGMWLLAPSGIGAHDNCGRVIMTLGGAFFSYQATRLMLAHISADSYRVPLALLWPLPLVVANEYSGWLLHGTPSVATWLLGTKTTTVLPSRAVAHAYAAYVAVLYAHCLWSGCKQVATAAGLQVFHITKDEHRPENEHDE